jgi:hypothetical protein
MEGRKAASAAERNRGFTTVGLTSAVALRVATPFVVGTCLAARKPRIVSPSQVFT